MKQCVTSRFSFTKRKSPFHRLCQSNAPAAFDERGWYSCFFLYFSVRMTVSLTAAISIKSIKQKTNPRAFASARICMAEMERFELSRRAMRPMPLAGAPLQPLEYFPINDSTGRIRTYDRSVNSRLLYHWATVEYIDKPIIPWFIWPWYIIKEPSGVLLLQRQSLNYHRR